MKTFHTLKNSKKKVTLSDRIFLTTGSFHLQSGPAHSYLEVSMQDIEDISGKTKNQLEILKRIDTYIGTTNTKCTIIMSYCAAATAFIFTLLAKFEPATASVSLLVAIGIFSALALALALICMTFATLTIFPITASKPDSHRSNSLIFFGDIASLKNGTDYSKKICEASDKKFLEDLNEQIFSIASIADRKFGQIKKVTILLILHFTCMATFLVFSICYFLL